MSGNDKANNCFISHVKYMTSTSTEEQEVGYTAPTKLAAILQGDYYRYIGSYDGVYVL
tara:strand:+ start:282 stop:455 length:174 start_codon:yes stop_codon:yes gene_type:complete